MIERWLGQGRAVSYRLLRLRREYVLVPDSCRDIAASFYRPVTSAVDS